MLLAVAATVAALGPGSMDRTFAHDGTLRSSFGLGSEVTVSHLEPLASGKLAAVLNSERVMRLRASGRVDRSFRSPRLPLNTRDIAEDPVGGLIIARTSDGFSFEVTRLRPDGRPDRAFGSLLVDTNAAVSSIAVAMAPDGTAFVAAAVTGRLTVVAVGPDGRLVPSFGHAGMSEIAISAEGTRRLVRLPDGRLRYLLTESVNSRRRRLVLAGMTADGAPDRAVGPRGLRVVSDPFSTYSSVVSDDVAADPTGRMVFSMTLSRNRGDRLVMRALTPDGERDPAFGHRGVARFTLPYHASWSLTAMRSDGAAAVTLTGWERRHPVVALVGRRGRLVRGFGRRGYAIVRGFPRRGEQMIEAAEVDRLDRLVLGGLSGDGLSGIREDFGRDFAALARMRLRRSPLVLPARADVTRAGVMRVPVRCRAAGGCRGTLKVTRGALRRQRAFAVRAGARRVLRIRLGRAGSRLAARRLAVRLTATVTTAARTEPLAVRVRLRPR